MPSRPPQFQPYKPARPTRDGRKAERDGFYSSARWMRLRRAFLAEHPLCNRCRERGDVTPATIAHHVEERLARPDLEMDPANLEPLCDGCHTAHHNQRRRGSS